MGKEQELLEAARSGNFAVVEKILSQRAKKTGPLASLRRGPGANTQDQSGYTSLHHSALNGHKDIVSVLLAHEASTNVVDNKGSTPLHLAAWTGNTEIVKLLLVQGPSTPNVNLSNHDHETALHSAAQYGHTEVVSLLLQHGSDASVRNLKEESPLDLAAQYGRLETVELLVKHRPELLRNNTQKHSPLHLASRNGHKHVVKVLLEAGFDVNLVTETGSALHEAALFGKIEVVKHLLDYRVDVNIEDCKKRTVFDLLDDLNTAISKQTRRLIKEHTTLVMTDDEMESPPSISPPPGFLSDSGSYANVLVPERPPHLHGSHMTGALGGGVPLPPFLHPASAAGRSPPRSSSSPGSELFGYYEVPPPPRLANPPSSNSGSKRSSGASDQLYQTPPLAKSHDSSFESRSRSPSLYETPSPAQMPGGGYNVQDSAHSSAASLQRVSPLPIDSSYHLQGQRTSGMYRASRSLESDAILYEIPPPSAHSQMPPGKRLSDPYQNQEPGSTSTSWTGGYLPMSTFQSHSSTAAAAGQGNKPQPPAKPPRRSIAPVSPVGKYPPRSGYEYLCLATSAPGSGRSSASRGSKMSRDDYVDMKRRTSYEGGGQSDNELEALDRGIVTNGGGTGAPNTNTPSPFSTLYDDIASGKLSSGLETNSYTNYLLTKSTPTLLTHGRSASDTSAVVGVQRNQHRISNYHPQIPSKPSTLDLKAKRATVQIPLSPTHYNQPPTPDFPPPSPGTAVTGILEKIRPLSQDSSDEGLEEDIQTVEYRNSKRLSRAVMVRSIFLRGFDQDMAERIGDYMKTHANVKIIRPCVPVKVEQLEPRRLKVTSQMVDSNETIEEEYETVVFAIGRDACTTGIGLENVGVNVNPKNRKVPAINEQTNVPNIYAIGDILEGRPELTPVAIEAGTLLARRLYAGSDVQCDYNNIPTTVFTPLEYGCIGLAEEAAIEKYGQEHIEVYHSNFTPLEWSVPKRPENFCYAKLICNRAEDERIVGFHYLGPNAGEVTQGFALGMRLGAKKSDFDAIIGIHPTCAEIFTTLRVTKRSGENILQKGC